MKNYLVTYDGMSVSSEAELRLAMEEDYYVGHSDAIPADESTWWESALEYRVDIYDLSSELVGDVIGNGYDLFRLVGWDL